MASSVLSAPFCFKLFSCWTVVKPAGKENDKQDQHFLKYSLTKLQSVIAKNLEKIARFCLALTFLPSPVSMLSFNRESLRIIVRGEVNSRKSGVGETTNNCVNKRNKKNCYTGLVF